MVIASWFSWASSHASAELSGVVRGQVGPRKTARFPLFEVWATCTPEGAKGQASPRQASPRQRAVSVVARVTKTRNAAGESPLRAAARCVGAEEPT